MRSAVTFHGVGYFIQLLKGFPQSHEHAGVPGTLLGRSRVVVDTVAVKAQDLIGLAQSIPRSKIMTIHL